MSEALKLGVHLTHNFLAVSNGWSGISGTLLVGLQQGGAVTIIYGLIFTGLMNVCIAASLAELSSAMPSAGGQVSFTAQKVLIR